MESPFCSFSTSSSSSSSSEAPFSFTSSSSSSSVLADPFSAAFSLIGDSTFLAGESGTFLSLTGESATFFSGVLTVSLKHFKKTVNISYLKTIIITSKF